MVLSRSKFWEGNGRRVRKGENVEGVCANSCTMHKKLKHKSGFLTEVHRAPTFEYPLPESLGLKKELQKGILKKLELL